MKLLVGLGNYPKEYDDTRHNVGFFLIDLFAKDQLIELNEQKMSGLFYKNDKYIVLKPLTLMNLSGKCIKQFIDFFRIKINDVLIIFDDIYTPIGTIKYKTDSGDGGHNGIKNIIEELASKELPRIKIGVGPKPEIISLTDFVLDKFSIEEKQLIKKTFNDFVLTKIKNFLDI